MNSSCDELYAAVPFSVQSVVRAKAKLYRMKRAASNKEPTRTIVEMLVLLLLQISITN